MPGRFFIVIAIALAVTASWPQVAAEPPDGAVTAVSIEWHGAVAGDVRKASVNSRALAEAYAAARATGRAMFVPLGDFYYDRPVELGGGGTPGVRVAGAGKKSSRLIYTGAGDAPAMTIKDLTRFRLESLSIIRHGPADGTGVLITSAASGSSTGPAAIFDLHVAGFSTGVQVGEAGELVFQGLELERNRVGLWSPPGARYVTNISLWDLYVVHGSVGVLWESRGGIRIRGGSMSRTADALKLRIPFAESEPVLVSGLFVEGHERFLTFGPDSPATSGYGGVLLVENCTESSSGPPKVRIKVNAPGAVTFLANRFGGLIEIAGRADAPDGFQESAVTIIGNQFSGDPGYLVKGAVHTLVRMQGNIRGRSGYILGDEVFYLDRSGARWNVAEQSAHLAVSGRPYRRLQVEELAAAEYRPLRRLTLPVDAVADLTEGNEVFARIDVFVAEDTSYASYLLRGDRNMTVELHDPEATFSPTKDRAGSLNVYFDGDRYRIQNKTRDAKTIDVFVVRTQRGTRR